MQFVSAESQLQLAHYGRMRPTQLGELIAANPKHRDAEQWKVRRGLALYLDKKYAETIAAIEPVLDSISSKPLRAEALYLLGSAQIELKQPGSAVRSLTSSLSTDPHWKQADETMLAARRLALQQAGDVAAGARAVRTICQVVSQEPRARSRAPFSVGRVGVCDGGLARCRAVQIDGRKVSKQPVAQQSTYGLAWTELSQQNFPAAIKTLDALISAGGPLAGKARLSRGFARTSKPRNIQRPSKTCKPS